MKVLIFGSGKSGTTALTYCLKNELLEHEVVFEPASLSSINYEKHELIVKYIGLDADLEKYIDNFDKKVLLIRHPFDQIISLLLYQPYGCTEFLDDGNSKSYIELLIRKTESPKSVRVSEIVEQLNAISNVNAVERISIACSRLIDYYKKLKSKIHVLKYEDFVDGQLNNIEEYLGISLKKDTEVAPEFSRVKRTKKHSDWKNWFTDEDIEKYYTLFSEYNNIFKYSSIIESDYTPLIDPKHSYLYTQSLIKDLKIRDNFQQGDKYESQMNLEQASECYKNSIELNPQFAPAYLRLARVLKKQGKFQESLSAYQKATALKKDWPSGVYKEVEDILKEITSK